ncbi:serine hydrolase [Pseudomonas sp. MPC6]|uniref:serine hydrolase domain-containing protein n=1 Tax=unclassified Pseudomonas TaxID=196821 RepID=UPI00110FF9BC|nr:serine hydrolase [Pseudomonas sp. MPC6]QCY09446.1 class C beta-lactamase-related serine hydrolase [Pseudomonas sp. MPC6]
MSEEKVLSVIEDAPHIELNQDGSTINLCNWGEPANRNWSYRHTVDVLPYTQEISRGEGEIRELGEKPVDLSAVTVHYRNRDMLLEEYLKESHCDGFLVLKDKDIVYQNYRRMAADERHLCQSVSKTTVCAVIGELIVSGVIDPSKSVDHYIPGVASGYAGVTVQNLLDMNVALKFSEDFTDPGADIFEYEMISGWRPDSGGQAEGILPYLRRLEQDPDFQLDGGTHYLCPNTDMLGCIIEQVTGKRFTELFQEKVYRHLGAEADACFTTDATGMAVSSGGLIIRLKDLARYGQLYANRGVASNGVRVLPEGWINDCLNIGKGTRYYLGKGYQYHNQITSNGIALCHLGVGGQMLYANTETKVVVVQFSTTSIPSNGDLDVGNALYNIADTISEYLSQSR